jgi:hypothetical protein
MESLMGLRYEGSLGDREAEAVGHFDQIHIKAHLFHNLTGWMGEESFDAADVSGKAVVQGIIRKQLVEVAGHIHQPYVCDSGFIGSAVDVTSVQGVIT